MIVNHVMEKRDISTKFNQHIGNAKKVTLKINRALVFVKFSLIFVGIHVSF
jgi:hypothetical protein